MATQLALTPFEASMRFPAALQARVGPSLVAEPASQPRDHRGRARRSPRPLGTLIGTLMGRVPCVSGVPGRPFSCSARRRRRIPTHPVCGTNLALVGPVAVLTLNPAEALDSVRRPRHPAIRAPIRDGFGHPTVHARGSGRLVDRLLSWRKEFQGSSSHPWPSTLTDCGEPKNAICSPSGRQAGKSARPVPVQSDSSAKCAARSKARSPSAATVKMGSTRRYVATRHGCSGYRPGLTARDWGSSLDASTLSVSPGTK